MPVERERLVLSQNVYAAQVGVEAVGKSNVNDAVNAAEGHSRLGPVAGQRIKALACSSS
jgi:hypothetical protein